MLVMIRSGLSFDGRVWKEGEIVLDPIPEHLEISFEKQRETMLDVFYIDPDTEEGLNYIKQNGLSQAGIANLALQGYTDEMLGLAEPEPAPEPEPEPEPEEKPVPKKKRKPRKKKTSS